MPGPLATLIVAFLPVMAGCATLGESIAYRLYSDIDVPIDSETAVTVTSYPPSSDIRAVIGGKGEGLDCSIPPVLEKFMFRRVVEAESSVSLQFRQGCVYHDYCYRHGYATYGYAQADCDFALLEQSFRTCMQIYGSAFFATHAGDGKSSRTEVCQQRAREVLLGVRIGGQGSFKARGESTFYEFDPLPARAEDYAVARLVRVDPEQALMVGGERLIATAKVLRFKRGRVLSREMRWTASRKIGDGDLRDDVGIAFPQFAIPTPPTVVRSGGRDWLLWLNRGSAYTTGFNAMVTPASVDAAGSFRVLPCPMVATPTPCDFDASVVKVAPPWPLVGQPRFFAFTHRFSDRSIPKQGLERRTVGLHYWQMPQPAFDGSDGTRPPAAPSKIVDDSGNGYRFLQSELTAGEFRRVGCPEVLALGRGIKVAGGRADKIASDVGDGYEEGTAAGLMPLTLDANCPGPALMTLALPQSWEPVVPVRTAANSPDRLLSMSALSRPGSIRLHEFRIGEEEPRDVTPGKAALDSSWAQAAGYVVRGPEADRLFLSRVLLDDDAQSAMKSNDRAPERVRIEFIYFDAAAGEWIERGRASCDIDLIAQQALVPHNSLSYALHARLADEAVGEPKKTETKALFSRLYRKELVRRWIQSQVIPGYIFDRGGSLDAPLDVAIIFHGSADYSVLLKGTRSASKGIDGLTVAWPDGPFSFISCA